MPKHKLRLSVVIAVHNEERTLGPCLESVKPIADEIIIVDGDSTDRTVAIARQYGAHVISTTNKTNFHINKQMGNDAAKGEWILQLDADERVSNELINEIRMCLSMDEQTMRLYQDSLPKRSLFLRHQQLVQQRDGAVGTDTGPYVAFFLPRSNYFLGRYMKKGGVYPDGVIRLFKRGSAYLPCRDVHEQYTVNGRVGWLQSNLLHDDSPTFEKYYSRWKRYVAFLAEQFANDHILKDGKTSLYYIVVLPLKTFIHSYFLMKGIMDGWQGLVFAVFSSARFAAAYIRYVRSTSK